MRYSPNYKRPDLPEGVQTSPGLGYGCKYCGARGMNTKVAMKHDCARNNKITDEKSCDPGIRAGGFHKQIGRKYV